MFMNIVAVTLYYKENSVASFKTTDFSSQKRYKRYLQTHTHTHTVKSDLKL